MAMPFRPADSEQVRSAEKALLHLKQARDLLTHADSPRTLAKVRDAVSSAKGAVRHAKARSVAVRSRGTL